MPVPENECLGERMKESIKIVLVAGVESMENNLKTAQDHLATLQSGKIKKEKTQLEFDIERAKSLVNTFTNVERFYQGVLKTFDDIPVCPSS